MNHRESLLPIQRRHSKRRLPIGSMRRRQALLGITALGAALITLREATAQSASKVPVIGLLDGGERMSWWNAFRQGMRDLGYVEGKNIAFEARSAKGKYDQLPALAEDLARMTVASIFTAA